MVVETEIKRETEIEIEGWLFKQKLRETKIEIESRKRERLKKAVRYLITR